MGFDASSVDAMTYDFTSWGIEARGTIPEPSDAAVRKFRAWWRGQMPAERLAELDDLRDKGDLKAYAEASRKLQDELSTEARMPAQLDAIAELFGATVTGSGRTRKVTGGNPSRVDMGRLPYRVQVAFVAYVLGELEAPKGSGAE